MRAGDVLALLCSSASAWSGLAGNVQLQTVRVSSPTSHTGRGSRPASNPQLATRTLASNHLRVPSCTLVPTSFSSERCVSSRIFRGGRVACCADEGVPQPVTERMLLTIPPEPTSGSAG
eukprot:3504194-Pleurochrysis_carterae.AAC.1